ncbi:ADP-ribose pyrophosphatase YjhB, NUDIX family [Paenibacillus sp. yr247]|uniref:NUDIX hydrolase n=1 Tax=Paenibacillus sp. yr247 TaxID=1761880 RepID=UPI00088A7103|nr:NUDIX hydrolase [Paenibacillus sp. yr247]SDP06620.1 ADP-ribose pyrophosphatase YjhB, NUDIX family [Paenibacillus sp. yr247]
MEKWTGSAAICINEKKELLMILQGKPEEEKRWSVPSGGKNTNESYEQCCVREVWEETGYKVAVNMKVFVKGEGLVHYFEVNLLSGVPTIQDPDELIHEIAWKSASQIAELDLCFEEDRQLLLDYLMSKV